MAQYIYNNGNLTLIAALVNDAADLKDNGKEFIFGYRDGKFGYYTSTTKSDDTFVAF